jgi:hypothetical protein
MIRSTVPIGGEAMLVHRCPSLPKTSERSQLTGIGPVLLKVGDNTFFCERCGQIHIINLPPDFKPERRAKMLMP